MSDDFFTKYIQDYQKLVFGICIRMTQDYLAAEDLTQETFLAAYKHRNEFDGQHAKAWLCRIAANKCVDYNRQAVRRLVDTDEEILSQQETPEASPEDICIEEEVQQKLSDCCRRLKCPYDRIAVMYFCEGKNAEEIAGEENKNVKTVQTQIYRARDMLRRLYGKEENTA